MQIGQEELSSVEKLPTSFPEVSPISDAAFKQESRTIFTEMNSYLTRLLQFQESPQGQELGTRARHISRLIQFCEYTPEKVLQNTIKAYKDSNRPYDELKLKAQVQMFQEKLEREAKQSLQSIAPTETHEKISHTEALTRVTDYLQKHGITLIIDPESYKIKLSLDGYPVELDIGGKGIMSVNINEGEVDYLDKFYNLILQKSLSQMPVNSVFLYPAIGNDTAFYNAVKTNNQCLIGIDGNPEITLPKEALIHKQIETYEDYQKIEEELVKSEKIQKGDNVVLVFKGFDTLDEVPQEVIDKIIDGFPVKTVMLIGSRSSSYFGWGIPSVKGKAYKYLSLSNDYAETTDQYFDEESLKLIDDISELSNKFEWTTGFFPGTEIKIYSRK